MVVPLTVAAALASGAPPAQASFALIIGVNQSVDGALEPLRYADDDAARFFDLFGALGARTYLIAAPDENTVRLHPQAAAEAQPPRRASVERAVEALARDVESARGRGLEAIFYFIYAGHGTVREGAFFLSLEDALLGGEDLVDAIIGEIAPDRAHLIIDACNSFMLAYSRGPGGERVPVRGFAGTGSGVASARIGLLLSTSAAAESHEWEAFQAGVFSHEVRSGLFGAADADQDGAISYREIAAFVDRANGAVPNERYRPRVLARPPQGSGVLVDLRPAPIPVVRIDGAHSGRYRLEDAYGVRLADFHSHAGQAVTLRRLPGRKAYLRRLGESPAEYALPNTPEPVDVSAVEARPPRTSTRGAAHDAFERLFALPFGRNVVEAFPEPQPAVTAVAPTEVELPWRKAAGWTSLGLAAAAVAGALGANVAALRIVGDAPPDLSHREVMARNAQVDDANVAAAVLYAVAGVAAGAGILLLSLPAQEPTTPAVALTGSGVRVTW